LRVIGRSVALHSDGVCTALPNLDEACEGAAQLGNRATATLTYVDSLNRRFLANARRERHFKQASKR
jgi:hypothetical protein